MYTEVKAAIDSVKIISDILRASKDLRDYNELASAISEVNAKLLSVSTAALASNEKVAARDEQIRLLEQELMQFKNWETTSQNYILKNIGTGVFAYIYKPSVETGEPRHWACPKCFQERR